MAVTERDHLLEEAVDDALYAVWDGDAGIRIRSKWPGDEIRDASEDTTVRFGPNFVKSGGEERESTTDEDLGAGQKRTTACCGGDHVPLDVGVADDAERPELRHLEEDPLDLDV